MRRLICCCLLCLFPRMDNKGKNIVVFDEGLVSIESLPDNILNTYQDSEKPYVSQTFDDLEDVKQFYLSSGG